jgi:dihydrolipoamide dehydrogenase
MANENYDVLVIGAGPGGYVAAIRAAQLGFKTAVVEKRATLGGACLNIGCIPSKALLQSSELYEEAKHKLGAHGVKVGKVDLDLGVMLARKDSVVAGLTGGVASLFKKNKIAWLKGAATLQGGGKVAIANGTDAGAVRARHIIIATGSDVALLPGVTIDERRIVSSTGALVLSEVPKTMAVIGAGYIGLEMGTVWRRLGADVTVIEYLDRILPGMDAETAKLSQRIMTKQGLKFVLGTKVVEAKAGKTSVSLTLAPAAGGPAAGGKGGSSLDVDVLLVAVGRKAHTEGLGLEAAGVELDDRGRIKTDAGFATAAAGVYAIGDVIAGPMLAHKAEDEGMALAELLAGQRPHINYDAIPGVVYTWPEIASVGKTEEDLKAQGVDYAVGKFPFTANARARANADTDGMVKILADAKTDRVLGCHIIGPDAGNMIHELALAIEFGAAAEDIARTSHAHPTLNEAVREAALAVAKRAIHI